MVLLKNENYVRKVSDCIYEIPKFILNIQTSCLQNNYSLCCVSTIFQEACVFMFWGKRSNGQIKKSMQILSIVSKIFSDISVFRSIVYNKERVVPHFLKSF